MIRFKVIYDFLLTSLDLFEKRSLNRNYSRLNLSFWFRTMRHLYVYSLLFKKRVWYRLIPIVWESSAQLSHIFRRLAISSGLPCCVSYYRWGWTESQLRRSTCWRHLSPAGWPVSAADRLTPPAERKTNGDRTRERVQMMAGPLKVSVRRYGQFVTGLVVVSRMCIFQFLL